jgi:endonuclease YncB( thermonuclease family)
VSVLLKPSLLLLFSLSLVSNQDYLTGKVVSIQDGDTITILVEDTTYRIRLYGIDCPERGQAYGTAARNYTGERCFGDTVLIRSHGTDKYGRLLGEVILADSTNLNELLVGAGMAWWYKKYVQSEVLESLEKEAREYGRGLWNDPEPMPPWEFRRSKR